MTERPRRKRPHPARGTRRAVGGASLAASVAIVGLMVAADTTGGDGGSNAAERSTAATGSDTAASAGDSADTSGSADTSVAFTASSSSSGAAVSATPAAAADTSSHGS